MTRRMPWDYLIVTASGVPQARVYQAQLDDRARLGLLDGVGHVMTVPDRGGRRIGSGGSTVWCLMKVLRRELADRPSADWNDPAVWEDVFRGLRILIVHTGGDSKRLPAYGACGKLFVPMPVESDRAIGMTLFDCQIPVYLGLPAPEKSGYVVVTSGDVLLDFDPGTVRFSADGVTGLGCYSTPEAARKHGVFAADDRGRVRFFLQKPSAHTLAERAMIDRDGRCALDVGVVGFGQKVVSTLLHVCQCAVRSDGEFQWQGPMREAIETHGFDFYREFCCAMGRKITRETYREAVCASGSRWTDRQLDHLFNRVSTIPFQSQILEECKFLHFGTTRELVTSGLEFGRHTRKDAVANTCINVGNEITGDGCIGGANAWVEGARVNAPLTLGGDNVVVGADVEEPLSLPAEACLDVTPGYNRANEPVHFIRLYQIDDHFHEPLGTMATLCGCSIDEWLKRAGAGPDEIWDDGVPDTDKTVWNARLFPAEREPSGYRRWLWMLNPEMASSDHWQAWLDADRYSLAEMAIAADREAFLRRRLIVRSRNITRSLHEIFSSKSGYSAADLALTLSRGEAPETTVSSVLMEAHRQATRADSTPACDLFASARILHSLGSALDRVCENSPTSFLGLWGGIHRTLSPEEVQWLEELEIPLNPDQPVSELARRLRTAAVKSTRRAIVRSGVVPTSRPSSCLQSGEIGWGHAPVRLDLGGGWTDTPPYSLERGGSVVNVAVDLCGQPPIHAFVRVIGEPVVRISSVDLSNRVEIRKLAELLDYQDPTSEFALVKAALAQIGFSPETGCWPPGTPLDKMLKEFGGGLEISTLAAVPKGSGLGASSIMAAVVVAVLHRIIGRQLTSQDLIHATLKLEQSLTTGGGWQDQVGGIIGGAKLLTAAPRLIPEVRAHLLSPTLLNRGIEESRILLYYTGITRLAKDILRSVVGRYLDRDRIAMATLRRLHAFPKRAFSTTR